MKDMLSRWILNNKRINTVIFQYYYNFQYRIFALNYRVQLVMLFNQVNSKIYVFAKITCNISCRNCLRLSLRTLFCPSLEYAMSLNNPSCLIAFKISFSSAQCARSFEQTPEIKGTIFIIFQLAVDRN